MMTTRQRTRFKTPLWHGLPEAPCAGARSFTNRLDIAQPVEQQTWNLWVAGSIPAIELVLTRPTL